jgi:hypothetical protein
VFTPVEFFVVKISRKAVLPVSFIAIEDFKSAMP